jgi:hypothetical protein
MKTQQREKASSNRGSRAQGSPVEPGGVHLKRRTHEKTHKRPDNFLSR